MKKYFLILILTLSLLNGCTEGKVVKIDTINSKDVFEVKEEEDIKDIEEEYKGTVKGKGIEIAKEYVREIGQYKNNNGRELKAVKIYSGRCKSCIIVELVFYLDAARDSKEVDKGEVKVTLEKLEVVDSEYSQKPRN